MLSFLQYFDDIESASEFLEDLKQFSAHFSEDHITESSAKDALIDSTIKFLQTLKSKS